MRISNSSLHLIIAILCLPIYIIGGQAKILLLPYVLYLLFSMNPRFFPALVIHFLMGTLISYSILVGCLLITIFHIKQLKKLKLWNVFILAIIPLPYILYITYLKYTSLNYTFIEITNYHSYMLGLFPFFALAIINDKSSVFPIKKTYWIFWGVVLIMALPNPFGTIRYIFFSIPLLFAFLGYILGFYSLEKKKLLTTSVVVGILLFITASFGVTSTLLFSGFIAFGISFLYFKKILILKKWITPVFLLITILVVFWGIESFKKGTADTVGSDIYKQEFSILDYKTISDRAKVKLFEDRAPLWTAVMEQFVYSGSLLPYAESGSSYLIESGYYNLEEEDVMAAHNVYLELIRYYGIIAGIIYSLIYIILLFKTSNNLKSKSTSPYIVVFTIALLATGFFGGMTGQFPIMMTFSFAFWGIAGMCYSYYRTNLVEISVKPNYAK